ncbi:MAG TPA: hypothetical protein VN969_14735 [Streptosporangiaceae bacterium]|nr:hypothetical protein [Streptosporangiaceae bacterium]
MTGGTEARLDGIRGRNIPPRSHNARTIAALAANPGCGRRALMDAAGVDKQRIAAYLGHPAPFGQSSFAIARGNAFEAQVKAQGAAELLTLLREHLNLDIPQAHYDDLNDVGGNTSPVLRHTETRNRLANAAAGAGTMFDHPLLTLEIAGRRAYLEPDLIAFQLNGTFHVIEIKSFPVIDGQADPDKVAAAAIQSAVYVLALRQATRREVADEVILVCPENFANRPVATSMDVRKQLTVLTRQLARLTRIDDLLDVLPYGLTFDLDPDSAGVPRRKPADLTEAIGHVDARYAPECLSTCEMCFFCRDEAAGQTATLGKQAREDLGGVDHIATILHLARGTIQPEPGSDLAEAATLLRSAAGIRAGILRQAI